MRSKFRRQKNFISNCQLVIWTFLLALFSSSLTNAQTTAPSPPPQTIPRTFPSLFNVAKDRPIQTVPADSTCGVPARNAYCISTTSPSSYQQCIQGFCEQTCPGRTALPNFANLLIATSRGFSTCIEADTINVRPGSDVTRGDYATAFTTSGPLCFLSSDLTPTVGSDGAFTLTAWIWLDQISQGYVPLIIL